MTSTHLRSLFAGLCLVSAVGCAGRQPQPVALVNPADRGMNCAQLHAAHKALGPTESRLAEASNRARQRNLHRSIVAFFFYPFWFSLDLYHADYVEWEAVHRRRLHLANQIDLNCPAGLAKVSR
jgi:hypothetical protein